MLASIFDIDFVYFWRLCERLSLGMGPLLTWRGLVKNFSDFGVLGPEKREVVCASDGTNSRDETGRRGTRTGSTLPAFPVAPRAFSYPKNNKIRLIKCHIQS